MHRRFASTLAAAALTTAAFGCDSPSVSAPRHPASAVGRASLIFNNPVSVTALTRTAPLAEPVTVSQTIGPLGGTIAIPGAGLTVVVPPLAVSSPTTISVTALAGMRVAYEFAPHGLTFAAGVTLAQDLSGTDARNGGSVNPLSLSVGYFTNSASVTSISELLSASADLGNQLSTATIWHFSGYMWAAGRTDDQ